ncbi:hypothetical protein [Caulobacter sp. S45]|uniref:hypothetical protein n=1 Tax=Caulobacter sp. S45 TaxID=1641861 RepID=UPI001574EEA9|nr:hypothetical protein [Caulobacter sp. S45]
MPYAMPDPDMSTHRSGEPRLAGQPQVPLINDPHAPEVFTTGCCGLSIGPGTVTVTFESARCDHSDPTCPIQRVVVNRMVMPIQAAQALVLQLNDALQRSGLSPSRAVTAGMAQQ